MTTDRALLIIALIFIFLLATKNSNYSETINTMEHKEKVLVSQVKDLEFSNEKIEKMYNDSINEIEEQIQVAISNHIKDLKKVRDLSYQEVKKELLENIKIENDTSKPSGITQSESKELLIEKRTLQYQVNKLGLNNAKLGVENNGLKYINYNLNKIIEKKDQQLNNNDEIIKLINKHNRTKLIKVGSVCIGLGLLVGALL